jgi:hypothetical protein
MSTKRKAVGTSAKWEIRYAVTEDRVGNFVIEMAHRITGEKKYLGAVPGKSPNDFATTGFDHFEDASSFPFPSEQTAAAVILSLPKTNNLDFAVVVAKAAP